MIPFFFIVLASYFRSHTHARVYTTTLPRARPFTQRHLEVLSRRRFTLYLDDSDLPDVPLFACFTVFYTLHATRYTVFSHAQIYH